jgi:AAA ATPase containing von Willebrand factor type A (vWA) domain
LSNKYKEELNKIVMNDDMKKRILQNVLAENKKDNNEEKEIKVKTTMPKVKKYNAKRNMQMAAACGAILICLSVAKSYPMLFKHPSNDLEQNEVEENHEDKNNDLKSSDDSELVYNNDSKEASDNDHKEDIAVDQNNTNNNKSDNNYNNGSSHVNKNINNASKAAQEGKDNLQSNSGSDEKKRQTSGDNDNKSIENSNTSSKTNHKDDINNKESKNPTSTDQKASPEDVKENKISGDNTDDSVSSTPVAMDKDVSYSQEYKTLDEAEKALNLKVSQLKTLPTGFKVESVSVISNELIQVDYNNGNSNMVFRAGKSTDNISGDYNTYQVKTTVKVNGIDVTLQGNKNEEYNLATWKKDDISYSISTEDGINEKTMLDMIV